MNKNNLINVEYALGNCIYNITETEEVHMKLQIDTEYLNAYFSKCASSPELVSVVPETISLQEDNGGSSKFKWNDRATKFFLKCYLEKKEGFRDPKIKKKSLWVSMLQEMRSAGFQVEEEEILDRKMRNMRKTYKTIKDNNKKSSTGRGRVSWEHFEAFEEIFSNDRTVNCGHTVASMTNNEEQPTTSAQAYHTLQSISPQNQTPTRTQTQHATSPQNQTPTQTPNQTNQRNRMSSLQNMRKKFLSVEEEKVEIAKRIHQTLLETNNLLKKKMNCLRKS